MSLEQKINYHLNKYPDLKKVIKRIYQRIMYALSSKVKSDGNIIRVSPNDSKEYFFGYYDKSTWDCTNRYMLCMRANNTWADVAPKEAADIILIDTANDNTVRTLATTNAWNVQQGCMAQWLGPHFDKEIVYNDFRDGRYCSVALNIETMKERVFPLPVYTVSENGNIALSLDFSRLHRLRKGYGYSNLPDETEKEKIPDRTCLWKLDFHTGEVIDLLKYTDFVTFETRSEMIGSEHKVNHVMLRPDGKRFMILHRWFNGSRKYTRLVTCNIDGSDMYNLSDDDMVSHCFWKNNEEIIAFENKRDGGPGYYLMKDKTKDYKHLWTHISNDGHPSFSSDGKYIVTDSYPNRERIADIKVFYGDDLEGKSQQIIAKVFAPFKYDNDTRCDLHPRWSRDNRFVCFDSVFEGKRGLYIVKFN